MCSKGKGVQQRVSPFSLLLLRSCRLPSARGGTTLGGTHSHFTKAQREREREKGPCRVREREREGGRKKGGRERERETGRVLCLGRASCMLSLLWRRGGLISTHLPLSDGGAQSHGDGALHRQVEGEERHRGVYYYYYICHIAGCQVRARLQ